jgi:predicted DsbA family dithiol-disulfide isomerase
VRLAWHSFLLRPEPDPNRTLEKFRQYTQSWLRPAADADAGTFRVWATDAGPPTHSVPPHLLAKAAARFGTDAFDAVHERLLYAYFADNRDITRAETMLAIWVDAGLPRAAFEGLGDPALVKEMVDQHNAAVELGVTGVPAVRVAGTELFVVGAQPVDTYRRWIARVREMLTPPA